MSFNDKTFDNIMAEMMAEFPKGIRTDEGSLAYNACAKIATALEEAYMDLDDVYNNLLPDNMDIDHLIRYAKLARGIEYKYATAPHVKAVFSQEIEIGERFTCNDYDYTVVQLLDGYTYELECETEGVEANTNLGELNPIEYIEDYQGGEITELIELGTEDEDEEEFRVRVIESYSTKAFSGNKSDYIRMLEGLSGVGGCRPLRRTESVNVVELWVIGEDYGPISAEQIVELKEIVDPTDGEGDGLAPLCHVVEIKSVETKEVDFSAQIAFDAGYSLDTSRSQIEAKIEEYLLELRKAWKDNGSGYTTVKSSAFIPKIMSIPGIADIQDVTVGGDTSVTMEYTHIPIKGQVTLNGI